MSTEDSVKQIGIAISNGHWDVNRALELLDKLACEQPDLFEPLRTEVERLRCIRGELHDVRAAVRNLLISKGVAKAGDKW